MFKNLKIGTKIWLGFAVTLAFLIILSCAVYLTTKSTNNNLAAIGELSKFQQSVSSFTGYFTQARIGANVIYTKTDQDEYNRVIGDYNKAMTSLNELRDKVASGDLPEGIAKSLNQINTVSAAIDNWKKSVDDLNASNIKLDESRQAIYKSSDTLTSAINDIYYDQSNALEADILTGAERPELRSRRALMQQGVQLMVGAYTVRSSYLRVLDFLDMTELTFSESFAKNLESNLRKITLTATGTSSVEYQLGTNAQQYLDEYLALVDDFLQLAQTHQKLIDSASGYATDAANSVANMVNDINAAVNSENESAMQQGENAIVIALVVSVIALGMGTLLAFMTVRNITGPINDMVQAARQLAAGNLNMGNLKQRSKDEIGVLTGCLQNVSRVVSDLIGELHKMSDAHDAGETDAVIPIDMFEGSYGEVAIRVNSMIGGYLKHINDMCKVLDEFGHGNFNAEYAKLPGKKAMLNKVIEQLRRDLQKIHEEIDFLASAALNGDLSIRAADHHFHGDWKKLLNGLNSLMDAFLAPIHEASAVMLAMSQGDLKAEIQGDYRGDFAIIKKSLNSTQEAISSYVTEISEILKKMSDQNLNVEITREYIGDFGIIKDSINMIIDTFNNVLSNISITAAEVAAGSRTISESSATLSSGASEQAGAVEQLNSAIGNVAEQIDKNAEVAGRANELASNTKQNAETGNREMKGMLDAMQEINASSANISKVIKVIQDIAFQTNLLALNAAVEAARAGRYGKGFAVVAQEVQNLANKSQKAAKETAEMVQSSIEKVVDGSRIADKTAEALAVIINQMTEVGSYVQLIATASSDQSAHIGHINKGIEQVLHVTQSNTAISEEGAASAQELAGHAEVFENTVAKFKLKKR